MKCLGYAFAMQSIGNGRTRESPKLHQPSSRTSNGLLSLTTAASTTKSPAINGRSAVSCIMKQFHTSCCLLLQQKAAAWALQAKLSMKSTSSTIGKDYHCQLGTCEILGSGSPLIVCSVTARSNSYVWLGDSLNFSILLRRSHLPP